MKYIFYFYFLLTLTERTNAIVAKAASAAAPAVGTHFVRKGVGERDCIIEEYDTCVSKKTDFIFYDIDLYTNEFLEISCGKDQDLEPLKYDKYFDKSNYINNLTGPYQRVEFNDAKRFTNSSYNVETEYFPRGKYWRIYNKGHKVNGDLESIYLHCYNQDKTISSTIQINLIGDWKLLKKENEFVFDKDKFSSSGKDLTYIKSLRHGTSIKTTCKDSKLKIDSDKNNATTYLSYSPYKLLSSSSIQYRDISKEALEIKDGVNTIDLRESNRTLLDLKRCQTVITCEKQKDRKLIYVYPKYDELKGLNPKSEEAHEISITGPGINVNSFTVKTLKNKIVSFHIPTGTDLSPKSCPEKMLYSGFEHPENIITNLKLTQISEGISILDTSSVLNSIAMRPYCSISSGGDIDDKIGIFLEMDPTCDISNKDETASDYHCTMYSKVASSIVIKSSEEDISKLKFIKKYYIRDYSEGEGTDDIWYTESSEKRTPSITQKSETEVHIRMENTIVENPLYLISGTADDTSVKNPTSVVEIHMSNFETLAHDTGIAYVNRVVKSTTQFYSLILEDKPWKLSCNSFLDYNRDRPNKPLIYPNENNKIFLNVPNGKTDPKTLVPVSITDHYAVSGYEFSTTSKYDDLEINIKNPLFYSKNMKPIYYVCAYNTEGIETRGIIDPYAVIQIIPFNKKIEKEQCGIKGPYKNELGSDIPCELTIKTNEDKFGYFCPTHLDIPEPEKYPGKSEDFLTKSTNQIDCKYGTKEGSKAIGKEEFYELLHPEGKDDFAVNVIFFSSKTPLFRDKIANTVTCTCKGENPITVNIIDDIPEIDEEEDGFLGLSLGFSIFSMILGSIYII